MGWRDCALGDVMTLKLPGWWTGRCDTLGEVYFVEQAYWPLRLSLS